MFRGKEELSTYEFARLVAQADDMLELQEEDN